MMEVEITLKITGKRPLMMHNPAGMGGGGGTQKVGKKEIPTPEVEAEAGAYRLPDGRLYLKSEMFHGSALKACSGMKIGPARGRKYAAKPILAAALQYPETEVVLHDPEGGAALTSYVVDVRRAVVQQNGVLRARPRLDRWECHLRIIYDDDLLTAENLVYIFSEAGKRIGVGDQRPGAPKTPGPFGTYMVELMNGPPLPRGVQMAG